MSQARYLMVEKLAGATQFVFQNRTEKPVSHMNKDKTKTLIHYIFEFKNRAAGNTVLFWISPRDAEYEHGNMNMLTMPVGTVIEAYPNGTFVNWRFPDGSMTNREAVDNELSANKGVVEYEKKHVEVVTSQILHGFFEACLANGKTPKEAYKIALEAYGFHALAVEFALLNKEAIIKKAKEKLSSPDDEAPPLYDPNDV